MTTSSTAAEATPCLILRCAGVTLALPLAQVVEVVLVVAMAAPLLRAPRYCLGTIDYHGQLAPLIDLGARLGLSRARTGMELPEGRILILRGRSGLVGYLTDEVLELWESPLLRLPGGDPALGGLGGLLRGMIRHQGDVAIPLLDPFALLPVVAGERLRQALAALAQTPEDR